MSYYFSKTVNDDFNTAIEKFTEELKKEGFGILTQCKRNFEKENKC